MSQEPYHIILNQPNIFWAAVCDENNVPDVARVAGLAPVEDISTITFYMSEAFGKNLLVTIKANPHVTLLVTCMNTFESYQYKGIYRSMRPCTKEEEEGQRWHLNGFIDNLHTIGIPPEETAKISRLNFQQPSHAVTFHVQQIFMQTPQKGAGKIIYNVEANHE
ncbi:MAG TPA: pyridoxamine 5'-phosphate oxidase family protein [Flavisolibacter sp.]|nr:pyridoxamine 5'-phosphate oxidase family protein [Flavisolibacter sp.]